MAGTRTIDAVITFHCVCIPRNGVSTLSRTAGPQLRVLGRRFLNFEALCLWNPTRLEYNTKPGWETLGWHCSRSTATPMYSGVDSSGKGEALAKAIQFQILSIHIRPRPFNDNKSF